MSRTKELKTSPEFNVNMFELFSLFSPNKKTKYTETLLRIMKKTPNIDEHCDEIKVFLSKQYNIQKSELDSIPNIQLVFFYRIVDGMFNSSDINTFQKFCEYNERGLIKQNDVSTYQSFDEINNAVSIADIIAQGKDLEKQIKLVYEDDEWLFVRPLTFNASKKYGSNTKWCTTTESNSEYFTKYASRGVLIYCLNKKTGYKVASFRSLDKGDPEFSWWNQKDSRIDSLQSELPDELLKVIRVESMSNPNYKPKTNRFLLSDKDREIEDKFLSKFSGQTVMQPIDIPQPQAEERTNRIRRGIERNIEEEVGVMEERSEEPMGVRRLVDAMDNLGLQQEQIDELISTEQPMDMDVAEPVLQQVRSGSFDFRNER
jgi:hypothetical protein